MYDFEALASELLQQRPELTREELSRRIEEKKRTVGAGYLTDQGALFLVAGEMGVSLRREEASADMRIKDLYIGANDVTVVARVLAVYPVASYNKKDGGKGKYARLVLFDGTQSVKLTVWEEGIDEVSKLGLQPDTVVRVANAYVKQGLDGKPVMNLGRRGRIEIVADDKVVGKLPQLQSVATKAPRLTTEEQFVALDCVVASEPRYSEFVRSDGSEGSLFQFGVEGQGGKETRVVVWSPSAKPELKRGQKIRVTNVRARRSSNGDFEVHGDAGTAIVVSKSEEVELRVGALVQTKVGMMVLALGKDKRVSVLELGKDAGEPAPGDVIAVTPDSETDGRLYCRSPSSVRVTEKPSFPALDDLSTKLQEARTEDARIMVEVIALSRGTIDDIRLKDGTDVKKGELMVGDDTGEIKLVGWRELADRVTGIQPGERLRILGVAPKALKMGGWVLQLSSFSAIERLRGPG